MNEPTIPLQQWTLFADVDPDQLLNQECTHVSAVPSELPGQNGVSLPHAVRMGGAGIDLIERGFTAQEGALALFYCTVHCKEAKQIYVGAGADWWMNWYVNGTLSFATEDGNDGTDFALTDHSFSLDLEAGENLVVVEVLSGMKGWKFNSASLPSLGGNEDAGKRYRQERAETLALTEGRLPEPFCVPLEEKVLAGHIRYPQEKGPFPSIVIAHGGGPQNRNGFARSWSTRLNEVEKMFLKMGYMVVSWDKPGTGESTGDWAAEGIMGASENLAEIVRFIHQHPKSTQVVGVWGLSQGGMIGPRAASMCKEIDFVISASSSWVKGNEQEHFRIEMTLRELGFSEVEIADALKATIELEALPKIPGDDLAWSNIMAFIDQHRSKKWFPRSMLDYTAQWGKGTLGWNQRQDEVDRYEFFAQVSCPVLFQWGQEDAFVDCAQNVEIIQGMISQYDSTHFKLITYPGADHGLNHPQSKRKAEVWADVQTWLSVNQLLPNK